MTNEEIMEQFHDVANIMSIPDALDLARADERAKLSEGAVKVWVSLDSIGNIDTAEMYSSEPYCDNGIYSPASEYGLITDDCGFQSLFNIKPGECKAFEIREVYG